MAVIHDMVVDTLDEDVLESTLALLGGARLVRDPTDPDEPFLTEEEGYLVVRLRDQDPVAYAREVQRRVRGLRVVKVVERTAS